MTSSNLRCAAFVMVVIGVIAFPICAGTYYDRGLAGDIHTDAMTAQYTETGPLNFSSDMEFKAWAELNAIGGTGTAQSPYLLERLNVTNFSGPSLKLTNITETCFVFYQCDFMPELGYPSLDFYNVSNGVFNSCNMFGAVYLNVTSNLYMTGTCFMEDVHIHDTTNSSFYLNCFDVSSYVVIYSILTGSANISISGNIMNGTLYLGNCESCHVTDNYFFGEVYDNGVDNLWNSNFYHDYDDSGVYVIPGSAGSIDQNPMAISISTMTTTTDTIVLTTGTTSTSSPEPPPTTSTSSTPIALPNDSLFVDLVLVGIIAIEILILLVIANSRKHSTNY